MLFYKILTAVLVAVIVWHMVGLQMLGRRLAKERDTYTLERHRSKVACIGCITLIVVALIEVQIRMSPIPYASGPFLLWFHLVVIAMMLFTGAILVLRLTGLRSPFWHRRLAYSFFVLYALTAVTGAVMLINLPGPA